jgi:hypothetical protein
MMSSRARIVKISKDDHFFPRDEYTGMIQSEYMATANQLEIFAGMATKR